MPELAALPMQEHRRSPTTPIVVRSASTSEPRYDAAIDSLDPQTVPFAVHETAADVMLGAPKTLPATASVDEVRRFLEDDHVRIALLADGASFRGAITAIEDHIPADASALQFAQRTPHTISPRAPAAVAFAQAQQDPHHRVVVLDDDGETLLGLICVSQDGKRLCRHAGSSRLAPPG
jgi:CBS domain-containing protein